MYLSSFSKLIFDAYFNGNSHFFVLFYKLHCSYTKEECGTFLSVLFMKVTMTFAILAGM